MLDVARVAAAIVIAFGIVGSACREPKGACVFAPIGTSVPYERCREETRSACTSLGRGDPTPPTFTPSAVCGDMGFTCVGAAGIGAASRRRNADGTCPPGSM